MLKIGKLEANSPHQTVTDVSLLYSNLAQDTCTRSLAVFVMCTQVHRVMRRSASAYVQLCISTTKNKAVYGVYLTFKKKAFDRRALSTL